VTEITDGAVVFDQDDLGWFAEQYGTTEWAVYVSGMDEVHTHQDMDLDEDDPDNALHTEESARAIAGFINTKLIARNEFDPVMKAVVLRFGIPVAGPAEK
jgi:hypothetical protein